MPSKQIEDWYNSASQAERDKRFGRSAQKKEPTMFGGKAQFQYLAMLSRAQAGENGLCLFEGIEAANRAHDQMVNQIIARGLTGFSFNVLTIIHNSGGKIEFVVAG